jgi:hypothetical protein
LADIAAAPPPPPKNSAGGLRPGGKMRTPSETGTTTGSGNRVVYDKNALLKYVLL